MRTRAYRRHHRARTVARHLRDWRSRYPDRVPPKDIAIRHPFDCGRHCELCHWAKFNEPRRARKGRSPFG